MASSPSRRRTCPSLPDDILLEIFAYLPLDSIHRFKSISKVWLSNLSHPNFITKWYQINTESLPWIHYHTISNHRDKCPLKSKSAYPDSHSEFISRNQHLFSLNFLINFLINEKQIQGARLYIVGSSNGLLLCESSGSDYQRKYHVCNPLTQKWVSIPSPPWAGLYDFDGIDFNGIVCQDPLSEICCYKIICVPRFRSQSKRFDFYVFASDLGEWIRFRVSCDQNVLGMSDKNVVTLNGVLFWLERGDKMLVYNLNQNNKSDEHRCSLVDLPSPRFVHVEFDDEVVSYFSHTLGESEGWVCYARIKVIGRQITVSVWMLDENNNWEISHKDISVLDTLAEICFKVCNAEKVRVIGFSPVDRNVVLLCGGHGVWLYNIHTRRFEELVRSSPLTKGMMLESFVLKTMPTVLPPPSWIDT